MAVFPQIKGFSSGGELIRSDVRAKKISECQTTKAVKYLLSLADLLQVKSAPALGERNAICKCEKD